MQIKISLRFCPSHSEWAPEPKILICGLDYFFPYKITTSSTSHFVSRLNFDILYYCGMYY